MVDCFIWWQLWLVVFVVGGGGDGDRWLWWCVRETKRGVESGREEEREDTHG